MTLGLAVSKRGLWPWALFAAMIASAGLPLYIHAPKLYAERYGIGLGTLGAVLGGLRLLDVVQNPALGWIAERFRVRRGALVAGALVLLAGMALAIAAFLWAATLGAGAGVAFGAICVASGAALGADLVLLPALFARRLGDLSNEAAGFSLWALVSKLALALSAATVLPALQGQGFVSGAVNSAEALSALSLSYAAVPCGLKAAALLILWRSPIGRE